MQTSLEREIIGDALCRNGGGGGEEIAAVTVEGKEWYLAAYVPEGLPTTDHLKLRNVRLRLAADSIPDRHVAVEMLWISVDPYQRTIITGSHGGLSLPQVSLNQAITTFGIGRIIWSKDNKYAIGDLVIDYIFPIAEYCVVPSDSLKKIDPTDGIELPNYLSSLGFPGFTAWVGIEVIGKPIPGSNVFISAAAGGVGMIAGQLAKAKGCRVFGSTGSDEKVKLLKEELGFDDAFNYKKEVDFNAALSKYFPNGIDVYFDNVGGRMLEAVLNHVNQRARIPLCGTISQYNKIWEERDGVRNLLNLVGKEVRIEGFMMGSHVDRFGDFLEEMEGYTKQGKIRTVHKIYHGIDSFLESLVSMFSSSNVGKVLIQVKP